MCNSQDTVRVNKNDFFMSFNCLRINIPFNFDTRPKQTMQ